MQMQNMYIQLLCRLNTLFSAIVKIDILSFRESKSNPGLIKRLKWSHMEDRLRYNILKDANKLTMPVLLLAGNNDTNTPPAHQKILFSILPTQKELHVIEDAGHTFRDEKQLKEIKQIPETWIAKIQTLR